MKAGRSRNLTVTKSPEETLSFGFSLGKTLKAGDVLAFFGEVGAGKTTLIKGIIQGICGIDPEEVSSPTYIYLNIYPGALTVYHFDLYRLSSEKDFVSAGFHEYLSANGVCCLEWSERIAPILPESVIKLVIEHEGEDRRSILVER